ncbi:MULTISPECIES: DNA-3-methyladenine glycosylase I [Spongiibacter]|uniref:DNA-3-methyladenine glycosylase I n=1 Tax=Spongiibacter TaxID=630749 RepID=UPI000C67CFCF|nr:MULTISPECIES: DNA-3-methyladenine glycosylase I [Spongiibacter]MAY39429.1 DNA-3-methyladenine glycosylase I [Spongiibacter sp.]MBI57299.1 DNA-3-methyladenine glycosylase I [Spongiibacter sp.]
MSEVCDWCGNDPDYRRYHDEEWGVPCRDDRKLFEFLILESAQAGLNWLTILRKREGYRRLFANFDPKHVARFDDEDIARLMADPAIIRNRMKIEAAINNARCVLDVQQECGSLADYLWAFVDHKPVQNRWSTLDEVPASTPLSDHISKAMKKRGFRFFGSTICYAYLQAMGLVNDHLVRCPAHERCTKLADL